MEDKMNKEDKRYCVYVHKTLDGYIFYVGSGTENRAKLLELSKWNKRGTFRGKKYSDFVESINYKYEFEIIAYNLSKDASLTLETELFNKYKNQLTNSREPIKIQRIDLDLIRSKVYYDVTSNSGLRWKTKPARNINIGDQVAHYFQILEGNIRRRLTASRVVIELHGIDTYGFVVDHIDGNNKNNTYENLRICTQSVNSRNRKKHSNNKSGITGIFYSKRDKSWVAEWKDIYYKNQFAYFSSNKFGYDTAKQMAEDYRNEKILELIDQGIGYTERHGK